MNQEQLMQALGNVDEDLIAEATSYERIVPRRNKWVIALVVALGVAVFTACGIVIGRISGVKLSSATIDREDPVWEAVLTDAPYANEMQYAVWEIHNNPMTKEIKSQIEEMEGKAEYRHRTFSSVKEMEDAYGIRLLKMGRDECHVQAALGFIEPENHSDGGVHLSGSWNAWEDDVYLFTDYSYTINTSEFPFSSGTALTKIEESRAYEVRSLGEVAMLVSGLIVQNGIQERQIMAFFAYDGICYSIVAMPNEDQDVTMEWLCAKLETLHK